MTPLWTQDTQAKALLARCCVTPPPLRKVKGTFGPDDSEYRYTGPLVRELSAIEARYFAEALAEGDASSDYSAAKREASVSVHQAIQAAILNAQNERAAA